MNVPTSRPRGLVQCAIYNAHKCGNAIKMQKIITSDRLILQLYGHEERRRYVKKHFRHAGVEAGLEQLLQVGGRQYYIYGYPAYIMRKYIQEGFAGVNLTSQQHVMIRTMAHFHISVELAWKEFKSFPEFRLRAKYGAW